MTCKILCSVSYIYDVHETMGMYEEQDKQRMLDEYNNINI